MDAIRAREAKDLNTYQMMDKSKGVVRIPIERAMELIAQRGLPVAPATTEEKPLAKAELPVARMGAGVAQVAAQSGVKVLLTDISEDYVARGRESVARNLDRMIQRGRFKSAHSREIGNERSVLQALSFAWLS